MNEKKHCVVLLTSELASRVFMMSLLTSKMKREICSTWFASLSR